MKRAKLSLRVSDITPLVRLWSEYYGQKAIDRAKEWLEGRRLGRRKTPCATEELDIFLAGDPQSALSKTRRLQLFRAFMSRLGRTQALLAHLYRKDEWLDFNELIAGRLATRRGRNPTIRDRRR